MKHAICAGDVLEPTVRGGPISTLGRVVDVRAQDDLVAFVELSGRTVQPKAISRSALDSALRSGQVRRTTFAIPKVMLRLDKNLSDVQRRKRDAYYASIEPLVSGENLTRLLYSKDCGAIIRHRARVLRIPTPTIYQRLARYYRFGCTPNAFLDTRTATRKKTSAEHPGGAARGRRRVLKKGAKVTRVAPHLLGKRDYSAFRWAYRRFVKKGKSVSFAHGRMMAVWYNDGYEDDHGTVVPIIRTLEGKPSERQFRYWLKHKTDFIETGKSREGEREWDKKHRAHLGSSVSKALAAGQVAQIDTTEFANGALVSTFDRTVKIKGIRAQVMVDVRTEYAWAIHISVETAKYSTARMVLVNCAADKVAFCRQYGVEITEDDWPGGGVVPRQVSIDQGELFTKDGRQGLVEGLNIKMKLHKGRSPDLHALIETRFGIVKGMLFDRTPGFAKKARLGRGARSPSADACLTFKEFVAILIRLVILYNKTHRVPRSRLSPAMIEAGIQPVPIELWKFSLQHENGKPLRLSPEEVDALLLPRMRARVTNGGIMVGQLKYSAKFAVKERWFELASRAEFEIDVGVDADDTSYIAVFDRNGDYVGRGTLIDPAGRYANKNLSEIIAYAVRESEVDQELKLKKLNEAARADAHIDAITKAAKEATRSQHDKRPTRQSPSSGAARDAERALQKAVSSRMHTPDGPGGQGSAAGSKASAAGQLFSDKARESAMALIIAADEQ